MESVDQIRSAVSRHHPWPAAVALEQAPAPAGLLGTWRSQIEVGAEPEHVLETLTDVRACEAWSPVGFDIDGLHPRRLRTGTRVAVTGSIAGRRVRFDVEIVRADPERLTLRAAGPVEMLADYIVRPADGGSRVDAAISLRRGTGRGAGVAARLTSMLLAAGALKQTLGRIARETERRHGRACGGDPCPLQCVVMSAKVDMPPPLHELEAEVMHGVWDSHQEEITVREVMDALNQHTQNPRAYTTYMTIMRRLDSKGLLTRRREGKTDIYRAVHSRERYADLRAQAGVDQLVEQYGDVALGHFARQMAELDPERRRQLQRLARKS
ncbi:MAG: hypothetical protein QOE28_1814 [Solirubrobacteraceae bacterium]|jgi:predicted transcriptional regulator|nr:hypothetical protein [Solirubrobacteraceae bacterium]